MDSSSSPILLSEESPVIILDETEGWWVLVQGSLCVMPAEEPIIIYPFLLTGFYLPVVN